MILKIGKTEELNMIKLSKAIEVLKAIQDHYPDSFADEIVIFDKEGNELVCVK